MIVFGTREEIDQIYHPVFMNVSCLEDIRGGEILLLGVERNALRWADREVTACIVRRISIVKSKLWVS
jgi:hypothetical protein